MQFSYRLYKKHADQIGKEKLKYKKYSGNDKEYYAKEDEEHDPDWKTIGVGVGLVTVVMTAIWIVNMK